MIINKWLAALVLPLIAFAFIVGQYGVADAAFNQGPKTCEECHKAEVDVWKETKHFKSFKTIHKSDKGKAVLAAINGGKSMKKNETCSLCHYTLVQKDAGAKPRPKAGPSCESCHGASSDWLAIHNDYGGKDVKREDEAPDHKVARIEQAAAAGMIWPHNLYDVATNCMTCHGLAHPGVDGGILSAMLGAEHPLNPDFELVLYSQGSVRHRFYPPDVNTNQEMDAAQLSRLFIAGQAAKLVSAANARDNSDDAGYQTAQQKRFDDASSALSAVPEAAALLADPTDANGRALFDAIRDKDLSGLVGGLLPDPGSYK